MIQYESELLHHGVKGMKWGVRRYQNPDGSLNAKGMKKLSKNSYRLHKKLVRNLNKNEQRTSNYLTEAGVHKNYVNRYLDRAKIAESKGNKEKAKKLIAKANKQIVKYINPSIAAANKAQDVIRRNSKLIMSTGGKINPVSIHRTGMYQNYQSSIKSYKWSLNKPKRSKRQYTKPSSKYRVSITGKDGITDTYTIYGDKKSREAMERRAKKAGATVKYH